MFQRNPNEENIAYRYRREEGLGSVNNAQNMSLSFPPLALRTRCVAAFLSSTTKRLAAPEISYCCWRIGRRWPSPDASAVDSTGSCFWLSNPNQLCSQVLLVPVLTAADCCCSIHWPTKPTTSSLLS